jgi:tetratricopeptide (TPR) repeat protein
MALAELRLSEAERGPERALEMITRALEHVQRPEDWTNALVDLPHARDAFERVAAAYRQTGRPDLAVQLSALYVRLAAPGRAAALRAEVYTEWARSRLEQASSGTDVLARQREESAAQGLFREAGKANAEAAAQVSGAAQGEQLWQAAAAYLAGEAHASAAAVLEQYLQAFQHSERQGEGWYLLAQSYRHLNHEDAARKAYLKCIEFPTAFAYRAQYHLALAALKEGQTDRAEEILVKNLQDMVRSDPDAEAQEKSLFMLGNLLYQRGNFRRAIQHLEEALGRYPRNPEATRAKYQLADSYRRLADQEHKTYLIDTKMDPNTRDHFLKEHQRWLQKAADEFAELAEFLQKPEARGHLSVEEQVEVPFIAADCLFNLGSYEKALARYEALAQQYAGRAAGLRALGGSARIYTSRGQWDKVWERLGEIRRGLSWLPPDQRPAWEAWLETASKQVPGYSQAGRGGRPGS